MIILHGPNVVAAKGLSRIRLGYWLNYDRVEIESFSDLVLALEALKNNPRAYVIRGEPIANGNLIRRRSREPGAYLRSTANQWLCVDVDALPYRGAYDNPDTAAEYVRSKLPQGLREAKCYYALTRGTTNEQVNCHLWFYLDRPYSDSEVSSLLRECPIDRSLYRPTQPHFTALPIVLNDPLANRRRGLLDGNDATLGEKRIVDPVAAWQEVESTALGLTKARKGDRHRKFNSACYHLARHVSTGAIARAQLEQAMLAAAESVEYPPDRAVDEINRAISDGLKDAGNSPLWLDKLSRTDKGGIKATHANVLIAFEHAPEWIGTLGFDIRTGNAVWLRNPPSSEYSSARIGEPLLEEHAVIGVHWLTGIGISLATGTVFECMDHVARAHSFDPLRDLLEGLDWDGVERLDYWLTLYFGAEHSEYTRLIGRAWLISAIARVMNPGCKADYMLVLEGLQGAKKSMALDILGMGYTREVKASLEGKDAIDALHHGTWLASLTELEAVKRTKEVESIKAFLTAIEDHYRPPYGRVTRTYKRSCVFCATTNESQYLADATGNRRFWPVACGVFDVDALMRDKELLWAEAVEAYRNGEQWWISDEQEKLFAEPEQAERLSADPWEDELRIALANMSKASMRDILETHLSIPAERRHPGHAQRVSRVMKRLGWQASKEKSNGVQYEKVVIDINRSTRLDGSGEIDRAIVG